jgi:hypothetical protein
LNVSLSELNPRIDSDGDAIRADQGTTGIAVPDHCFVLNPDLSTGFVGNHAANDAFR